MQKTKRDSRAQATNYHARRVKSGALTLRGPEGMPYHKRPMKKLLLGVVAFWLAGCTLAAQEDVDLLNERVTKLEKAVEEVKGEVAGLKDEVKGVKEQVQKNTEAIKGINEKLAKLTIQEAKPKKKKKKR